MVFVPELAVGQIIANPRLADIFGCGTQGGMRRAHRTNTLVLISNHVESIYDDRWIDGILHYTGMGTSGNQSLTFMQNRTLSESRTNGVSVFLFEVFRAQEYTFAGQVQLDGDPYPERQADQNGVDRQVWVFPLKPVSGLPLMVEKAAVDLSLQVKERQARKLSDQELLARASRAHRQPGKREVGTIQHDRNPWVAEYAKRRSGGKCDLCGQPAPFHGKDNTPYLENHHVVWLAKGGEDSMDNTVALCPNCHRKMHVLDLEVDRTSLLLSNQKRSVR